jgi:excisionase family DNA binding protein
MEPYLTISELAEVLRLSKQTIQRYVLNKEIPYLKIRKVIRFRPSDIERWVNNGGITIAANRDSSLEGDQALLWSDAGIDDERCSPAAESDAGQAATDGGARGVKA